MNAMIDWKTMRDGREKYAAYLASREWAVLKEQVKERSRGICEHCLVASGTQTHHQTYARKYRELLTDLLHVCAPCHEFLSGKTQVNPASKRPVLLRDPYTDDWTTPFNTVYLAGKITGTTWRNQIAPDWSCENDGPRGCNENGEWFTVKKAIPVGERWIGMTGPWWRPIPICGGHSRSTENRGVHANGEAWICKHGEFGFDNDENKLLYAIRDSIRLCDVLFAWIDSLDCYGTLAEIGYAFGLQKTIAVYMPIRIKNFEELWLARNMADVFSFQDTPSDAWNHFLTNYTK